MRQTGPSLQKGCSAFTNAGASPPRIPTCEAGGCLPTSGATTRLHEPGLRGSRPHGIVVLGVYNTAACLPLRLRLAVARLTGLRLLPFDAVLRERRDEPERHDAWLRDQVSPS